MRSKWSGKSIKNGNAQGLPIESKVKADLILANRRSLSIYREDYDRFRGTLFLHLIMYNN